MSHLSSPLTVESTINRQRYRRILRFFAGVIGHFILLDLLLGRVPLARRRVRASRRTRYRRMARRFRALAADMGGVLIKLGQFLSARVDVLPVEITEELAGLQDEVPAVPYPDIEEVLQTELGAFTTLLVDIEQTPLAAASLGQVHRAWLLTDGNDSEPLEPSAASQSVQPESQQAESQQAENSQSTVKVVVKVQRPGIDDVVKTDLKALAVVAQWAMRYKPIRLRADVPALMVEFAQTLEEELDYRGEADNAARFAAIFADSDDVRVPHIYRAYSTGRVLVMENVEGLKIDDKAGMIANGISPTAVADRLLDTYFIQVFQEGFFHADPHPGNIFVRPLSNPVPRPDDELDGHNSEDGSEGESAEGSAPFQIIYIDFGMMGRIQEYMGDNLRRLLLSVASQDAQELTRIYSDMGFFLPSADLDRIAEAQEEMLGRVWGRSLNEMATPDPEEIKELSGKFQDIVREFPFQVPQDFVYLGRAVGMISGLTSQLHPDINLWKRMEAYALTIVGSQRSNFFSSQRLLEEFRSLLPLPAQIRRLIQTADKGNLRVRTVESAASVKRMQRLESRLNRLTSTLVMCTGLLAGTYLYVNGEQTLGLVFWGVSGLVTILSVLRG